MAAKIAPPKLKNDTSYSEWKIKLDMRRIVRGYEKKEQAITVLLQSLNENKKVEKAVSKLKVTDLNVDDGFGFDKLIAKLDETFKTEKTQESYNVYVEFDKFFWTENMNINNYILEFEHLNDKMLQFNLKLPDNISCFKLLENASLQNNEKQMALTLARDLKYESMKLALKRISLNVQSNSENNEMNIKQEELLFTRREKGKFENKEKQKFNPSNKKGQTSRCAICDSKMHWAKHCLHRVKNHSANIAEVSESEGENTENVQIILITEKSEVNNVFVAEMFCSAVIDTTCSKTVAGIDWFTNYTKNLDDYSSNHVLYKKSNTPFKFGDRKKVYSQNKATIPAKVGKTPYRSWNCWCENTTFIE